MGWSFSAGGLAHLLVIVCLGVCREPLHGAQSAIQGASTASRQININSLIYNELPPKNGGLARHLLVTWHPGGENPPKPQGDEL